MSSLRPSRTAAVQWTSGPRAPPLRPPGFSIQLSSAFATGGASAQRSSSYNYVREISDLPLVRPAHHDMSQTDHDISSISTSTRVEGGRPRHHPRSREKEPEHHVQSG